MLSWGSRFEDERDRLSEWRETGGAVSGGSIKLAILKPEPEGRDDVVRLLGIDDWEGDGTADVDIGGGTVRGLGTGDDSAGERIEVMADIDTAGDVAEGLRADDEDEDGAVVLCEDTEVVVPRTGSKWRPDEAGRGGAI